VKQNGPLPALVAGSLVVVALATLSVQGGWMLWVPVLLALVVVGSLMQRSVR
jgi:hypothetical protein